MKRLIYAAPVLVFLVLAFLLFKSLVMPPPDVLPSALIDKPVPAFTLPPLPGSPAGLDDRALAAGEPARARRRAAILDCTSIVVPVTSAAAG